MYDPITEAHDRSARRHNTLHQTITDIIASYDANDTRGIAEAIENAKKVVATIKPYADRRNKYGELMDD